MIIETRLVSHDVGGRGFGVELKYPPLFRDDMIHVLYEADAACAEEMTRSNDRPGFFVTPYCLGERDGTGLLNIMANPYFSSLREPDPEFQKAMCEVLLSGAIDGVPVGGARYDARYDEENRVVRQMPVTIRSLDSLREHDLLPVKTAPDFLSVDVQGTDFEVLLGARRTIGESVLGLTTEIAFRPVYKGQALFSDIFDFALEEGFEFIGFTYLQEVSPSRSPVGERGRDLLAFGDALFFRRLDLVRRAARSEEHFLVMALKLAFIAICFERLSYAMDVLRQAFAVTPGEALSAELSKRTYFRFLKRLYEAMQHSPPCNLHTDRGKLVAELRSALNAPRPSRFKARAASKGPTPTAEIETILIEHGFDAVAALARRRRNEAQPYIAGAVTVFSKSPLRVRIDTFLRTIYRKLNP